MSFDPKSADHKKQLYLALRAVADITGIHPDLLIDQALGHPQTMGADYLSNFRRGNIAASKAAAIYQWLNSNHHQTARQNAQEIFPLTLERQFDELLEAQAITGKLSIKILKGEMGLVERAADTGKDGIPTIKIGQRFYFELESDHVGTAIALQGYGDKWHPFPLSEGIDHLTLTECINILPQSSNGKAEPLVENNDTGPHLFVVICSKDHQPPPIELRKIISWIDANECKINVVNCRFKG